MEVIETLAPARGEDEEGVKRDELPRKDPVREYEAQKSAWIAAHPEATPEQYQAAMTEIARRVGV